MAQPQHSRDMSTLVGTSKTLERAISGLQMSSKRLTSLLGDETTTPGIAGLIASLKKLTKDDQQIVDAILSHRAKPKRKHK
jgi:NADPH-dependent ferric siderophore reductase